jgi:6-phosphogluconolactonase/glucosamine-6-phosphate isomerase/deaminase
MSLENVIVSEDMVKTTEKLVDFMYDKIVETLKTRKICTIGLSGAEMIPLVTNELVKRKETFIKFKNSLVFLACDERFVPLDHVDSNFGEYVSRGLFKELVIPSKNLFAIDYEASEEVEKCAVDYDQRLRKVLNENDGFDILLLG